MERVSAGFKPYIMLAPVMAVLLGLFVGGIVTCLLQSLGYFPVIGLREITFKYYREVLTNPEFLRSLSFSLYISMVSSVIAVVLGVFVAHRISRYLQGQTLVKLLYKLPIVVPHTVAALMIFMLFSRSGIISRAIYQLGLISYQEQFPEMVFDSKGIGIVIAYIWKEIPFVAIMVYTILRNINESFRDVAYNLGASEGQFFYYVLLPISMPAIISSFIIIFAFSFGAFEVPYLLGPTYPRTLPVMAYTYYISPDLTRRPYTMVIAVFLTIISIGLILVYSRILKIFQIYSR
jgi:putative spermidine/putrescine transport system permease protein